MERVNPTEDELVLIYLLRKFGSLLQEGYKIDSLSISGRARYIALNGRRYRLTINWDTGWLKMTRTRWGFLPEKHTKDIAELAQQQGILLDTGFSIYERIDQYADYIDKHKELLLK